MVYFGRIGVERIKCYDSFVIGIYVVKSVYVIFYFIDIIGVLGYSLFFYVRILFYIVYLNYVGMKEGNFKIYRFLEKI